MESTHHINLAPRVWYSQLACYALLAAMLVIISYWNLARPSGIKPIIWLLQSFPLLVFIPGMVKGVYRAYSWLCFILLVYFVLAVERAFSSVSKTSDFVFLALIVLLFISAMMASRWLQRHQKGYQK